MKTPFAKPNHDGLESAESDLQSMFKKPGGNGAKLGHGKRFEVGWVSTGSDRRAATARQSCGLRRVARRNVASRFLSAPRSLEEGRSWTSNLWERPRPLPEPRGSMAIPVTRDDVPATIGAVNQTCRASGLLEPVAAPDRGRIRVFRSSTACRRPRHVSFVVSRRGHRDRLG
jgi:hypothetical protein